MYIVSGIAAPVEDHERATLSPQKKFDGVAEKEIEGWSTLR